MIKQNEITRPRGDRLISAVLEAFHRKGILTWHMAPAPRKIVVGLGPTTITIPIDLRSPEHDLAKALKMAPIVKKYVAGEFTIQNNDNTFNVYIADGMQHVLVTVPHPEPWYPTFSEVESLAQDDFLLGVDTFNSVVYYDLWNAFSSALVSGMPGSGKTNTLRLMAALALRFGWRVFLSAPKGIMAGNDSSEWEDIAPYCECVAINAKETDEMLAFIDAECVARSSGKKALDCGLLLIIDELLELDASQMKSLGKLLRVRRTAGFRGLLGTKVVGKTIPQDIRASVGFRLVHKCSTYIESQNATGMAGLGGEKLQRGEMVMVDPTSSVTRLVVAKADIEDIAALLQQAAPVAKVPAEAAEAAEVAEVAEVAEAAEVPAEAAEVAEVAEAAEAAEVPAEAAEVPAEAITKTQVASRASLFDVIMDEWKRAEATSSRGLQAPPAWILARASAYQQATGKLPSHKLMDTWHIRRAGKGMTNNRRNMVRNACERLASQLSAGDE